MNPPSWIRRLGFWSLLVGLGLVALGPVAAYGVASMTMDHQAPDPTKAFNDSMKPWLSVLVWTTPIGMAMVFQGVIGLLFLWVTKAAQPTPPDDAPQDKATTQQ